MNFQTNGHHPHSTTTSLTSGDDEEMIDITPRTSPIDPFSPIASQLSGVITHGGGSTSSSGGGHSGDTMERPPAPTHSAFGGFGDQDGTNLDGFYIIFKWFCEL